MEATTVNKLKLKKAIEIRGGGKLCVLITAAIAFVLPFVAAANVDDGLLWVFKAKEGVANGSTDSSCFRDQLTVSAATTKTLTFNYPEGYPICFTNMTVKSGVANATYENQPCLFLGQPTNYIDGVLHVYLQNVTVPKAYLATGTEASFFARIKWDGRGFPNSGAQYPYNYAVPLFSNGHVWSTAANSKGWSIWLNASGGAWNNSSVRVVVGNKSSGPSDNALKIYPSDGWVDLAVTLRKDGSKTYITYFICKSASHDIRIVTAELDDPTFNAPSGNGSLGSDVPSGIYSNSDSYSNKSWNFRGAISEVRLWNRCLSEGEIRTVFAGQPQGWTVGADNGSADEFSDTECTSDFNPRTMQWSKMRKTLTAANPSVSFTATFPADRRYLPRTLHVKPILSEDAAGAQLDVRLNGTKIGTVKLRDGDNFFFVREKAFRRFVGSDGAATFTLTRAGNTAGTVMFDFLELTGSFQVGNIDNTSDSQAYSGFTWASQLYALYPSVEETSVCTANLPPEKTLNVYFPLKQAVADHYRFRFTARLFWQSQAVLPLSFMLNGVAIEPTEEVTPTRTLHFDIAPGVLQENNKFSIISGVSTKTTNTDYGIDYYRLDVINTDKPPMVISFR